MDCQQSKVCVDAMLRV